jgi:hypothetical protein
MQYSTRGGYRERAQLKAYLTKKVVRPAAPQYTLMIGDRKVFIGNAQQLLNHLNQGVQNVD